MKIIVRGYGDGRLVFEEPLDVELEELKPIAERQAERLRPYAVNMVEIEFVDESDPLQRFFRFGTDKTGMLRPREIFKVEPGGTN